MISLNQIKKIIIFSIVSLIMFPNFASALSISELQAQIATLLNQVQQLQQQLSQKTGQSCFNFNSDMQIGGSGSSVASLQKVLESEGFDIDNNEINSSSFGESTASAVVGFQERYRSEILNPAGLSRGTGYIGARTRAKLNTIGCGTNPVVPTPTQPTPVVAPKPPFNVIIASAIDIDGSAKLDWNNVDGQKFYVYKNKNDGTFQFLAFTTDKFYKDTSGLSKDVKYGYYVTALNIYGESEPSSKVYVGPITTPTLTILSPQNNTTYSVIPSTVRWNVSAPVSPTATFLVELKAVNVSAYSSGQTIFSTTVTRAQAGCSASDECSYPLTSSLHGTQTITVKNLENNVSNSRTFTVTPIVTTPLTITTPSPLPNAKVGTQYNLMLNVLPTSMPTNQLVWSVVGGNLPSGLFLSASDSGMGIFGAPTSAGTYTFTLSATRPSTTGVSSSNSATKQFTLTVDLVATTIVVMGTPTLTVNGQKDITVNVGDYLYYFYTSTAGTASARSMYTADKADTCSGGVSSAGQEKLWVANHTAGDSGATVQGCQAGVTYTINYIAKDSAGRELRDSIIVRVRGVSTITQPSTLTPTISSINPSQGSGNMTATIYGTNLSGASSVQFYNSAGQNVAGILSPSISSVNSNSLTFTIDGVFVANVTSGTYQVKVVTPSGTSNGSSFTLIAPIQTLIITTPSPLPNAEIGTSYTAILGVSGGPSNVSTNSYNWSVTSGYIPSGLILGASDFGMVISGTPTAGGTYNFTLRASYGSQSGSKNFTLTVNLATAEVISYPTASLDARVGSQAYSSFITAKVGETIAYRWSSNADSAYSQYYVNPAYTSTSNCGGIIGGGPFTWVANNLNGSTSATVEACQAGRTYSIKYTAVNSQTRGGLSTDSVLTINVPSVTTALNTSSDLNQMANVLTSASAILKNMLNLLR